MKINLPKNWWKVIQVLDAEAANIKVQMKKQLINMFIEYSGMKRTCSWDHVSDRWSGDQKPPQNPIKNKAFFNSKLII